MAVFISTMKMMGYLALEPRPDTLASLMGELEVWYLASARKYTARAFTPAGCARVMAQLADIYYKGLELVGNDAPLEDLRRVVSELINYEVPKDLKEQFSNPIILPFPNKRKK